MNRARLVFLALALSGCGVSRADYEAKTQEAEGARKQVATLEAQLAQLQQQATAGQAKNRRIEITLVPYVAELVASAQNDKK